MRRIHRQILSVFGLFLAMLGLALLFNSSAGYTWGTEDASIAVAIAAFFFGVSAPIVWIETR